METMIEHKRTQFGVRLTYTLADIRIEAEVHRRGPRVRIRWTGDPWLRPGEVREFAAALDAVRREAESVASLMRERARI